MVCIGVYGSIPFFDNHTFWLQNAWARKPLALKIKSKRKFLSLLVLFVVVVEEPEEDLASFSSLLSIPTAYGGEYTAEERSRETTISKL